MQKDELRVNEEQELARGKKAESSESRCSAGKVSK